MAADDTDNPNEATIALDVGGTTTAGAVVLWNGQMAGPVRQVDSDADATADVIVRMLEGLLTELQAAAEEDELDTRAAGIAFPGPFDYAAGIPLMRHKFAALHGTDLRRSLEDHLRLPVYFINDAEAFAVGAWWMEHADEERLLGITLGTGVGSGFVVHGRPVSGEEGAPEGGEIWNRPLRGAVIEDAVSRRALETSYREEGGDPAHSVRQIAERAREGDKAAREAFSRFGDALGDALAEAAGGFGPERVVFGGQIAKAFDLFGPQAEVVYARSTGSRIPFTPSTTAHAALWGAARHAMQRVSEL